MRNPVCVKCQRVMEKSRIGVVVEYQNLNSSGEKISADLAKCGSCGFEVVAGFAERPFAFHFQSDYRRNQADVFARERHPDEKVALI